MSTNPLERIPKRSPQTGVTDLNEFAKTAGSTAESAAYPIMLGLTGEDTGDEWYEDLAYGTVPGGALVQRAMTGTKPGLLDLLPGELGAGAKLAMLPIAKAVMEGAAHTGKNTIRRYHGTGIRRVPDILEQGLRVQAPLRRSTEYFTSLYPQSKAIYTTSLPVESYFDPTDPYDALVVLDIPKDWYREAPRQSVNLEGGFKRHMMNPKVWPQDGEPDMDWYNLMPVQQGGRVDIFDKDIPPEFITEILQPDPSVDLDKWRPGTIKKFNSPKMQLNRIKTGGKPIPFDDIRGFSKNRPYWILPNIDE